MNKQETARVEGGEKGSGFSAAAIRDQLEALLSSDGFSKSPRMSEFLRYVVSETLAGNASRLKEYAIAVEVFERDVTFDPKANAVVRVEASRLRHRLREYFLGPGRDDPIHIALPPGSYVPKFSGVTGAAGESASAFFPANGDPIGSLDLPDKPSIAVLPLSVLGNDPEQEYFADGIAEDLITALSRVRWLFVIARNSTFAYKDQSPDIRQVSRELGVRYVVEGSVRKGSGRVRISAQLIDAQSGGHVWAQRYDRELEDIFVVQDEITETIVAAIESELGEFERERARRKATESLGAWERYQRGMWHLYHATADEIAAAQKHFFQAVEIDPTFASAWAAIAYSHFLDVQIGFSRDPKQSTLGALEAGRKAVVLDDKDPMAHFGLGRALVLTNDYDATIAELTLATELDPSFAHAYHGLGLALTWAGRGEEALAAADMAERLSPRDPFLWGIYNTRVVARIQLAQYEAAVEDARFACRQPNAWYWAYVNFASVLGHLGRTDEAQDAFRKVLEMKPNFSVATVIAEHAPLNRDHRTQYMERMLEGLGKAGLDIPDKPAAD